MRGSNPTIRRLHPRSHRGLSKRSLFLRKLADADAPPDLEQHEDAGGKYDGEDGSSQDDVHGDGDLRLDGVQHRPNLPRKERLAGGSPSRSGAMDRSKFIEPQSLTDQETITLFSIVF